MLTQARMRDAQPDAACVLPGWTPFDAAASWCLPRTGKDLEDVLAVYEEYVDRPLGGVRVPDAVARRLFSQPTSRLFFGDRRRPRDWWVPAALLVAVASHVAKVPAKVQPHRVLLELPSYRLEVTRRGCWSNFRSRMVLAKVAAEDADMALLTVADLVTSHPMALALAQARAPEEILMAANAAIRAEQAGRIPPILAPELTYGAKPFRGKSARRYSPADIRGAVLACRELIEAGGPGVLQELYSCAVPTLMTRQEFGDVVASPWNRPDRVLRESTLQRLSDALDKVGADC